MAAEPPPLPQCCCQVPLSPLTGRVRGPCCPWSHSTGSCSCPVLINNTRTLESVLRVTLVFTACPAELPVLAGGRDGCQQPQTARASSPTWHLYVHPQIHSVWPVPWTGPDPLSSDAPSGRSPGTGF